MGTAFLKVLTAFTLVIATSAPVAAEQFSVETRSLVIASVDVSATLGMSVPSHGALVSDREATVSVREILLAQSQPTERDTCNAVCETEQERCLASTVTDFLTGELSPQSPTLCAWIRRECRINCFLAPID